MRETLFGPFADLPGPVDLDALAQSLGPIRGE
jgi:hypothetical protein